MRSGLVTLIALVASLTSAAVQSEPTFYTDRTSFQAAVGPSVTDGYTAYGTDVGTSKVLIDAEMTSVVGETSYTSLTTGTNAVGDIFVRGDKTNYCAGCNGNFRLMFADTSYSRHGGVYGVGIDIVLHTSRYVSIGDDDPNNPTYLGTVLIQFVDGTTQEVAIPADIGYYTPGTYFLGLTDSRGIASITIGTEARPHFWVIDNLTVASQPGWQLVGDSYFSDTADTNAITFEEFGDNSNVIVLDDQYGTLGIDFNSAMISRALNPLAPGVNARSGVRTASPRDILDPQSGYRITPRVSFTEPVSAFGLWVTDTLGGHFSVTAFGADGAPSNTLTVVGPDGGAGQAPKFLGFVFSSPVSAFELRRIDRVNDVPPECCTLDFEIDDVVFVPNADAQQLLNQLATSVVGVGPGKSLANKIALAQTYYTAGDIPATCAVLTDFVSTVQGYAAGKKPKLSPEVALQLTTDAQAIMTAIGCN